MAQDMGLERFPDALGYWTKLKTARRQLELAEEIEDEYPILAQQYQRAHDDALRELELAEAHYLRETEHTQTVIKQENEATQDIANDISST